MHEQAIKGCILGTAVGDSLGLPYEGINSRRNGKFLTLPLRQHFFFGRGMISDDSEHTCFVAQALTQTLDDPDRFEEKLAWALRWWLLSLPAGIGFATSRAIFKLWLGFPPRHSGVFSAGNGPAMRSALLGVVFANDLERLKVFVRRSTRLTHSDPKAYFGALTIALAARQGALGLTTDGDAFKRLVIENLQGEHYGEYEHLLQTTIDSVQRRETLKEFVVLIGCMQGVSGYTYHTVPCVIHCWLRHQHDFQGGLEEIIAAAGDTDTTGAIYGAISGAQVGKAGIPADWLNGIMEWPRTVAYMEKLAERLALALTRHEQIKPPAYFAPALLLRNLLFLTLVLAHGFRRLLPPY